MCMVVKLPALFPQSVRVESNVLSPMDPESEPCQHLISAVHLTGAQNVLGTNEHIAAFVVNTLFIAILGVAFGTDASMETIPEKMTVWFKAYR